jgi:hypothetical protein
MRITFTLSDEQHAANDRAGIMVGLPLVVQLDAGLLVMGQDDGLGWFEKASWGHKLLKPISLDRLAFCGRIGQVDTWRHGDEVLCQALLDCGQPLRVEVLDPDFAAAQPGYPHHLAAGDWLVGVAILRGRVASDPTDLLWQPVRGTIVDIQRLSLSPTSQTFGTLRWFHGLPRQTFAPDQVFVTVEVVE